MYIQTYVSRHSSKRTFSTFKSHYKCMTICRADRAERQQRRGNKFTASTFYNIKIQNPKKNKCKRSKKINKYYISMHHFLTFFFHLLLSHHHPQLSALAFAIRQMFG